MKVRIIGNGNAVKKYIRENIVLCIISLMTFAVGVIVGTIYFNNTENSDISEYIEKSVYQLKENDGINSNEILNTSLIKNILIGFAFWILGASIVGIPALIIYIWYRGFTIGFTISTFIKTFGFLNGNILSLIMLFFHNAIILCTMIISLISASKLAYNLLVRKKEMKYELIRHTVICAFCMVLFVISSVVEILLNGPILTFYLNNMK